MQVAQYGVFEAASPLLRTDGKVFESFGISIGVGSAQISTGSKVCADIYVSEIKCNNESASMESVFFYLWKLFVSLVLRECLKYVCIIIFLLNVY